MTTDTITEQAAPEQAAAAQPEPDTTAPAAPEVTLADVLADGKARTLPELVQAMGQPEADVRQQLQVAVDALHVRSFYDGRKARRTGGRSERKYRATHGTA